jgi:hypothetical protein
MLKLCVCGYKLHITHFQWSSGQYFKFKIDQPTFRQWSQLLQLLVAADAFISRRPAQSRARPRLLLTEVTAISFSYYVICKPKLYASNPTDYRPWTRTEVSGEPLDVWVNSVRCVYHLIMTLPKNVFELHKNGFQIPTFLLYSIEFEEFNENFTSEGHKTKRTNWNRCLCNFVSTVARRECKQRPRLADDWWLFPRLRGLWEGQSLVRVISYKPSGG